MAEKKHEKDAIQGEIVHEYDGILEADNLLPRWWLITFYGTVVFSAGYWFYYDAYHIGSTVRESYAAQMEARAVGGEVTEELLAGVAADPARVAAGEALFATNCAVCHGGQGEGTIGPNLTDAAWIHGGSSVDIHHTITEGVGTAGMPAWGQTLGPSGVLDVVSFVLGMRDTNRPGRPPQGTVMGAEPDAPEGAAPGDGAPADGATAADGAPPAEGPAPSEEVAPADGTEGARPAEGGAPSR